MRASSLRSTKLWIYSIVTKPSIMKKKKILPLFEERKWKNKPCRMINHNSMIHRATIVAKYWICHLKVVGAAAVYGFILVVTLILFW